MGVSKVRIEEPRCSHRAFRFYGTSLAGLFDLLARPTAAVRLACGGHAPEVIRTQFGSGTASAFVPKGSGGRHLGLSDQIVRDSQSCLQGFAGRAGTVLREGRSRFEN